MLRDKAVLLAGVTASILLTAGAVLAANQSAQPTPADKDFAKLSADGSQAFQDLTLTRIAIFDGKIDQAKKYINDANSEFGKAKNDDTVFTKAEADLSPARNPNAKPIDNSSPADNTGTAASSGDMKKPVAWLPVDGAIAIAEDYSANPAKSAAVADANHSLKNGDHKAALEKLKLAGVDVAVTIGVVPLQKTLDEVRQAADLINDGKYYQGSQMVRQIQNNERFDIADASGLPKDVSKTASAGNTSSASSPNSNSNSSSMNDTSNTSKH